jgi:hypothetical protein
MVCLAAQVVLVLQAVVVAVAVVGMLHQHKRQVQVAQAVMVAHLGVQVQQVQQVLAG